MALLELITPDPDWTQALSRTLERPPGTPERRAQRTASGAGSGGPHRRLSDDLAWLRQAIDEPGGHGLAEVEGTAAVAIWKTELDDDRLCRLRDRGVLDAAGFLLHESSGG